MKEFSVDIANYTLGQFQRRRGKNETHTVTENANNVNMR